MSPPLPTTPTLQGFYLSFSGESSTPINNLYALSPSGTLVSTTVLDTSRTYQELRGMAFGPDVISDNYFCRLATTTSAGGSAVRTACATVRS